MTAEQILEVISKNYSESAFAYEEWYETENDHIVEIRSRWNLDPNMWEEGVPDKYQQEVLDYLGIGSYEVVDSYGGEGQGEIWYKVFHFTDHNVYIRIDGFYQSYIGTEFYSGYGREVVPQQKTITVFN